MWPKQDLSNVKKQNEILSRIPLKRAGVPNNIAEVVLFLIEHSDYITGQNIDVDGGRKLNM
jgi:NAD(P)-dependent dehydrogenase (short-subunit alcohol dehydrogenase family)